MSRLLRINHIAHSIWWIWRQTARSSLPIRGRDNGHTNRQLTEYCRGCSRQCTIQDKSTTCSSLGPRRWRKVWSIAFYLGASDIEDYIIVGSLQFLTKMQKNNEWVQPLMDDIQHTHPQWIIRRGLKGFTTRQSVFYVLNSRNIFIHFKNFLHRHLSYLLF